MILGWSDIGVSNALEKHGRIKAFSRSTRLPSALWICWDIGSPRTLGKRLNSYLGVLEVRALPDPLMFTGLKEKAVPPSHTRHAIIREFRKLAKEYSKICDAWIPRISKRKMHAMLVLLQLEMELEFGYLAFREPIIACKTGFRISSYPFFGNSKKPLDENVIEAASCIWSMTQNKTEEELSEKFRKFPCWKKYYRSGLFENNLVNLGELVSNYKDEQDRMQKLFRELSNKL